MIGLDERFDTMISTLVEQAAKSADVLSNKLATGKTPRTENLDSESLDNTDTPLSEPSPARFDRQAQTDFFEPNQARDMYVNAVTGDKAYNSVKNVVASKIQVDILALMEREFKARRTSRIRGITLEASRRKRQSGQYGSINMAYRGPLQDILTHGTVITEAAQ